MTEQKLPTPLPWETDYTGNIWGDIDNGEHDGDSPYIAKVFSEANAQLIVDSVNKTQRYKEALESIVDEHENYAPAERKMHKIAQNALKNNP